MQSRRSWGQNRFIHQPANDWNILSNELENILDIFLLKDISRVFCNFIFKLLNYWFFKVFKFLSSNV